MLENMENFQPIRTDFSIEMALKKKAVKRSEGKFNKEQIEEAGKSILAARACAFYTLRIKIRTPEVKSCVKSREPDIKSAENICF